MSLGDAGLDNSDASYTGSVDNSAVSVQYWRDKATEFQNVLNAVDETARAAQDMLAVTTDQATVDYLTSALSEYDFRKTALRLAAEGINAGAATINAAGGRFPTLSIPAGLGIAPLVLGAGALAALAAAAALIVWGHDWLTGVNERMRFAALMQPGDPEITRILARGEAARQVAEGASTFSSGVSSYLKWGAIAVLAFMAWPYVKPLIAQSRKRIGRSKSQD
jgi:hypothetical protein